MRIRSTRPTFWKSKTIASVSWDARLVLKALESYVDDNGVGKDDMEMIITECFGRDHFRDASGTIRRVSEAISELSQALLISQYEMNGESLIYIDRWAEHQYVQKPQKGRFPRPDGSFEYKDPVDPDSYRKPPEASVQFPAGVGEKGSRGVGEKGHMVTVETDGDRATTEHALTLLEPEQTGPTHEDLFHRFWEYWPRKVKKPEARTAFLKAAKREDPDRIIAGAERYAQDPNLPEAQFIPHPATWLNNDQWNDGPLPARGGQQTATQRRTQEVVDLVSRNMGRDEPQQQRQVGW